MQLSPEKAFTQEIFAKKKTLGGISTIAIRFSSYCRSKIFCYLRMQNLIFSKKTNKVNILRFYTQPNLLNRLIPKNLTQSVVLKSTLGYPEI